jgi:hypothetical protein
MIFLGEVAMSSKLITGMTEKFSESFGSGLAIGIVVVVTALILRFWIASDPITSFTPDATKVCESPSDKVSVGICWAAAPCDSGSFAIGGECSIEHSSKDPDLRLVQFGVALQSNTSGDPRLFKCNWVGSGVKDIAFVPHVRALCIKNSSFWMPSLSGR